MFDVLDELGRGGMGVVHRVYHREWRVQLAMKTPLPSVVQRAGGAATLQKRCAGSRSECTRTSSPRTW